MSVKELITKSSDFLARFAKKEEHKSAIRRRAGQLLGWVAVIAFIVSGFGLVFDGKEFFTVKIPKFQSYIGRTVLLRATFREETAKRVLEKEFGYVTPCVRDLLLVDLDNDGTNTDLVIGLVERDYAEDESSCPPPDENYPQQYVVAKEIKWKAHYGFQVGAR